MDCRVCNLEAPEITITLAGDNPLLYELIKVDAYARLGWKLDGDLAYCPEHHPTFPDDIAERVARARGDMLAKSKPPALRSRRRGNQ